MLDGLDDVLGPLARLTSLVTLRLETLPSWDASGKRTIVESLEPLAELKALEHVELFSVLPPDRSLEPLERLPSLVTARLQRLPQGREGALLRGHGARQRLRAAGRDPGRRHRPPRLR
jgi:hypothetical protein